MSKKPIDGGLDALTPSLIVIGLDPSLAAFGFTALDPASGAFKSMVYTSKQRGVVRLDDIATWVSGRIRDLGMCGHTVVNIAMEGAVTHSYAATVLGELSAAIRLSLYRSMPGDLCRFPLLVPPSNLKKFATGKGNARKNEIMLAVYRKWGVEMSDDNMADSFILAQMASGKTTLKYEQDVLELLADPKFRDQPAEV